jgi:hypothetical protein
LSFPSVVAGDGLLTVWLLPLDMIVEVLASEDDKNDHGDGNQGFVDHGTVPLVVLRQPYQTHWWRQVKIDGMVTISG